MGWLFETSINQTKTVKLILIILTNYFDQFSNHNAANLDYKSIDITSTWAKLQLDQL